MITVEDCLEGGEVEGEGAELRAFQLVEQSQHQQRLLEVDEDVDGLVKGIAEHLVLCGTALIGVFDGRDIFGEGKRLLERVLLDPLAIVLAEVVNALAEGIQ